MAALARPYTGPTSAERVGLTRWVTTLDHKEIGILYLVTTAVFLVLGGIEALLMRLQLAAPWAEVLGPQAYNALFTMHGTTMVFLVVMPMLLGFANYLVPLMIGARDMAFPRLNALSFWLLLFGGLVLYFGFLAGDAPDTGWFSYAPLTERPYSTGSGVDYWAIGLIVTSVGTIATAVNLLTTVVQLRAPGMTMLRLPIFVWMSLITALLILGAIPALTAAQVMLLFDRRLGTHFFDVGAGGDPVLWQHLFWYFGHPEVYIMVLPAFGMISEIIPVFSRKPLFGRPVVIASGMAIAFLSFLVWAHHMFTVGLGQISDAFFGATSMVIAIPTGIKVFSWLATMWGGRLRLTTAMLFAVGFVAMFTIGGLSGVHFAIVPIDWQTTDTYYVVAHMHYVLFGGTFFAILAATYYWFPKIAGRLLDERLGKWHFWLTFVGFNLTFFPMHLLGADGHAASGLHLSRPARLGALEPHRDGRRVRHGRLDAGPAVEPAREPAPGAARQRQSLGRLDPRVGDQFPASRLQLRDDPANPERAATHPHPAKRTCSRSPSPSGGDALTPNPLSLRGRGGGASFAG